MAGEAPLMRWNDRVPNCINCGSDASERRPRGYCSRCFSDAERLRQIERWDPSDSTTWIGGAYRGYKLPMSGEEYIARCRGILERRLAHRLHVEQVRRAEEEIDGLALEYAFDNLARAAGARHRQLFHGWATTLFAYVYG